MKKTALALLLILCPSPVTTLLTAQVKQEPEAKTAAKPDIDVKELEHRLRPLPKEELEIEAKAWLKLLREKVEQISAKQIETLASSGETKRGQLADVIKLQDERAGLNERVAIVLGALKDKGGKIEDYQKYVAAASGLAVNWFDPEEVWASVSGWLTSANGGIKWGLNLFLFVMTLIVFRILSSLTRRVAKKAVGRLQNASDLLRKFFVNFVSQATLFVGLLIGLSFLGVPIGPFLAAIGAAGFIIGFALQGTLNNFASGLLILIYRPYDIGNVITAAGVTGKVESMSMSSTRIKTPDNQVIIVPNGSIFGGIITNVTGSDTRRVDLTFGIGYDDDMGKAQRILEEVVKKHPLVLPEPKPIIRVNALADSSVNFVVRPWAKTGDYWDVYWDLTRAVKERFDAEGVSIPYPQRDVHLHQVSAGT